MPATESPIRVIDPRTGLEATFGSFLPTEEITKGSLSDGKFSGFLALKYTGKVLSGCTAKVTFVEHGDRLDVNLYVQAEKNSDPTKNESQISNQRIGEVLEAISPLLEKKIRETGLKEVALRIPIAPQELEMIFRAEELESSPLYCTENSNSLVRFPLVNEVAVDARPSVAVDSTNPQSVIVECAEALGLDLNSTSPFNGDGLLRSMLVGPVPSPSASVDARKKAGPRPVEDIVLETLKLSEPTSPPKRDHSNNSLTFAGREFKCDTAGCIPVVVIGWDKNVPKHYEIHMVLPGRKLNELKAQSIADFRKLSGIMRKTREASEMEVYKEELRAKSVTIAVPSFFENDVSIRVRDGELVGVKVETAEIACGTKPKTVFPYPAFFMVGNKDESIVFRFTDSKVEQKEKTDQFNDRMRKDRELQKENDMPFLEKELSQRKSTVPVELSMESATLFSTGGVTLGNISAIPVKITSDRCKFKASVIGYPVPSRIFFDEKKNGWFIDVIYVRIPKEQFGKIAEYNQELLPAAIKAVKDRLIGNETFSAAEIAGKEIEYVGKKAHEISAQIQRNMNGTLDIGEDTHAPVLRDDGVRFYPVLKIDSISPFALKLVYQSKRPSNSEGNVIADFVEFLTREIPI